MRKTAVLYARYSCSKQREVSIEDQLETGHRYCESHDIDVVGVYTDYALSGKTDNRPDFQRMIANAPESDYVVVYMMERFSRGKYDPSIYKQKLEEKGVRVLSALEYIPDAPEGVLIEKILEGQAAYFSLDTARKTRRGMESNARKAMNNGYKKYGYDTDPETRKYVINKEEAAIVREIYRRHIAGETINRIGWTLALRGIKTSTGKPVDYNWVWRILTDDCYTGMYRWDNIEVPGGMPRIIDEKTAKAAKATVKKKARAKEVFMDYLLSGKLICAICGDPMHGNGGRGQNGKRYYYYSCKKGNRCNRKSIRKEVIEGAIVEAVNEVLHKEGQFEYIAKRMLEYAEGADEAAVVNAARSSLKENAKAQANILKAIEKGIMPAGTAERLEELKSEEERLSAEVAELEGKTKLPDADELVKWLESLVGLDKPEMIINAFVNRVYLFDGYAVATMNFRGKNNELAEVKIYLDEFGLFADGARGGI